MGSGIAQVCAAAGHRTLVVEVNQQLLGKGLESIRSFLERGVLRGKTTLEERDATLANLEGTTELSALEDVDLAIEAVVEKLEIKLDLLARIDGICRPETIFASNTSSLSITELAAATGRPHRVVGMHFFNPVPLMKLVEVVRTILTEEAVFRESLQFVEKLGKTAIPTTDRTGFIVNRLLVPYILDAVRALEEGVGSIRDIDEAMRLGCGYPMGPLALLDMVGLDTTLNIANAFFEEFREPRFACPPLLRRMVMAGLHGRKTGKGFYDYGGDQPVPNDVLFGGG